jgi:hypothetical protein
MQSDALKNYSPAKPSAEYDPRYLVDELRRVQESVRLLVQVVKQLDARLTLAGF